MLFLRVHCDLDHRSPAVGARPGYGHASLASFVSIALAALVSNTLIWALRFFYPAWLRTRSRCVKKGPRLPHDLVPLVLDWSPTTLDPLQAYLERNQYFRTCALVHSSWTDLARAALERDLLVRDPTHPVLLFDCPIDPKRIRRITYAPKNRYIGSIYSMTACLRLFLPRCDALTSLSIHGADIIELTDLCQAPNIVELHLYNVRIGRPASPPAPQFKLMHLETLTLDEVGFSMFRPSYAVMFDPAVLPSLTRLSMHHCDLIWTLFPKARTFPKVTHFRFTHPGAFPVTHLSQLRFPALEHLTLCPISLRDILIRANASPEDADATLALVASATSLRILDDVNTKAPPARTSPPLPTLSSQHGLVLPPPSRGLYHRSLHLPSWLIGPDASTTYALRASLSWTWSPQHRLTQTARAHTLLLERLIPALSTSTLLPVNGRGKLELPSALRHGVPGLDSRTQLTWNRARARLERLCRERGIALVFTEERIEEVEKAREEWGGWGGCAERAPPIPFAAVNPT